jgi:broad specificity phosphatase PhoE
MSLSSPNSTAGLTLSYCTFLAVTVGAATVGALVAAAVTITFKNSSNKPAGAATAAASADALFLAQDRRRRLPQMIVLVRHGESEANADHTLWRRIPDNLVGLTDAGKAQAVAAGVRIESILAAASLTSVHLVVSPFERTLQTAAGLRPALEHRIVRTDIESRIREQECGNVQTESFGEYRREQQAIGRFWYRFPTGESGADVADRVKSWWYESVLTVNERVGYDPIGAMVIVTHGLTMRFILMQLYAWSPTTFHSVWNADNCDLYVLRKDLSVPGTSPYVLDRKLGDVPRSSIDALVQFKDGTERALKLEHYLSIPPPRTTRIGLIQRMLAEQYKDIDPDTIDTIVFMPFVQGGIVKGRSTSGVASSTSEHGGVTIYDSEDLNHTALASLSLESDLRCLCSNSIRSRKEFQRSNTDGEAKLELR